MKYVFTNISHKREYMRHYTCFVCMILFLLNMQIGFSQSYKTGDKVEAFINNAWREARILKTGYGKSDVYQVQETGKNYRGPVKNNRQVARQNLRAVNEKTASGVRTLTAAETNLYLGKYDLYSGIPTMYIGHVILENEGKYKVAFGTDESNYEIGNYYFEPASNNIIWLSGLFKNKQWGGKVLAKSANTFHIEFNKVTYAENN